MAVLLSPRNAGDILTSITTCNNSILLLTTGRILHTKLNCSMLTPNAVNFLFILYAFLYFLGRLAGEYAIDTKHLYRTNSGMYYEVRI